jgi:hypothetical protein
VTCWTSGASDGNPLRVVSEAAPAGDALPNSTRMRIESQTRGTKGLPLNVMGIQVNYSKLRPVARETVRAAAKSRRLQYITM